MGLKRLEPVFVEFMPTNLDEGMLYISTTHATVSHLCVCGCGERVVTPLGPADWTLHFDGAVSLSPSIGNGQFACGSHYMIQNDAVVWCRPMSARGARATHQRDVTVRERIYAPVQRPSVWERIQRILSLGRN